MATSRSDVAGSTAGAGPEGRAAVERPAAAPRRSELWGSDAVAEVLRALDIPYVALNPGASFRGLHDSLVNHLGNARPQMLLCLHEEHAVAIAQGWAKVTGRPLAVVAHSNVGLMHATMAIFNAWCDRMPVLVLGATGPVDAAKRRPWIDWIHTARDQGALVRPYVKWDDQPASVAAAQEALLRAHLLATTAPCGPVYVNLDAGLQEAKVADPPALPDVARFRPPPPAAPDPALLRKAAAVLAEARHPLILAGRVSRDAGSWQRRVALAEHLSAGVLTDLKVAAAFPTDHPLHAAPAGKFLTPPAVTALRAADVVLSLDWVDLAGTLKSVWGAAPIGAQVIQASVDQQIHNGWSMDHQGLPPVDLDFLNEPDIVVAALCEALGVGRPRRRSAPVAGAEPPRATGAIDVPMMGRALHRSVADQDSCVVCVPLSWSGELWPFRHPLDFLGSDGGGGIGAGPGLGVGAALALDGSGRLPIAILGDGDYLMGVTALWTAVHYRVPLLVVVANNRSFFNDELHQERVARARGRPVENRWIGQAIRDPEIDLAQMARAQGAVGIGPVTRAADLEAAFAEAVAQVRGGAVCVVDVRVEPGYDAGMAQAIARASGGDKP